VNQVPSTSCKKLLLNFPRLIFKAHNFFSWFC